MITDFREHLETTVSLPVHFISITELEERPCLAIRKTSADFHQALNNATGFRVTAIEIGIYAEDYQTLEDTTETILETYNGEVLTIGTYSCKFVVEDEDDDSFPPVEGSQDWVFYRQILVRVHYKK